MGAPVIWFELWVSDVEGAKAFYAALFDWTYRTTVEYDPQYWLIDTGGEPGGAILPGEPGNTARSGSVVYVAVADLAETLAKVESLGGSVERGATSVGDGTSFAMIRDPYGTRVGVWSP